MYGVGLTKSGNEAYAPRKDNVVCLVDLRHGLVKREFAGNTAMVCSARLSNDETYLVTGAQDNSVRLFDFHTGHQVRQATVHKGWVWAVEFNAVSSHVYSSSRDGSVAMYSVPALDLLQQRQIRDCELNRMALSRDGQMLAVACDDSTIEVLDPSLQSLRTLIAHKAIVFDVQFTARGHLISSDTTGVICVWDPKSGELLRTFNDHRAGPAAVYVCLSTDVEGEHLVAAGTDGRITVRHVLRGDVVARFYGGALLRSAAFHKQSGMLIAGTETGDLLLWLLGQPNSRRTFSLNCSEHRLKNDIKVLASDGTAGLLRTAKDQDYYGSWPDLGEVPVPVDRVHFTVTSPPAVAIGDAAVIEIWAHLNGQEQKVISMAAEALVYEKIQMRRKGPIYVPRGSVLNIRLLVEGLLVDETEDTILWDGEIGNASFLVRVPENALEGSRTGVVTIYMNALQIARLYFKIWVGTKTAQVKQINAQERRYRKAFASYSAADRDDVLARVQGMKKALPDLDVFLDVISLRSGQYWEKELMAVIPTNDIFYLFWSENARASTWVEKEWRYALSARGIDFIDPVPLSPPEIAPPPPEMGSKHFNDWVLAHLRAKNATAPSGN